MLILFFSALLLIFNEHNYKGYYGEDIIQLESKLGDLSKISKDNYKEIINLSNGLIKDITINDEEIIVVAELRTPQSQHNKNKVTFIFTKKWVCKSTIPMNTYKLFCNKASGVSHTDWINTFF